MWPCSHQWGCQTAERNQMSQSSTQYRRLKGQTVLSGAYTCATQDTVNCNA
jgi:hypothetical protein